MKTPGFCLLILLISSIAGYAWSKDKVDAEHLFEKDLQQRNIAFKKWEDGFYEVNAHGGVSHISLDNVKRNFLRDGDPDVIHRFVESILQKVDELPAWDKLSLHIYPSLEPLDKDRLEDVVHQPLSNSSVMSLAYFNAQSNLLHYWLAYLCSGTRTGFCLFIFQRWRANQ